MTRIRSIHWYVFYRFIRFPIYSITKTKDWSPWQASWTQIFWGRTEKSILSLSQLAQQRLKRLSKCLLGFASTHRSRLIRWWWNSWGHRLTQYRSAVLWMLGLYLKDEFNQMALDQRAHIFTVQLLQQLNLTQPMKMPSERMLAQVFIRQLGGQRA